MTTQPRLDTDRDRLAVPHDGQAIAREAHAERLASRTTYERWVKVALDRVGAALLLLLTLPLLAVVALTVLVTLGRPVLYRQTRVGQFGEPVEVLKFRTMRLSRRRTSRAYDGEDRRRTHKSQRDPRHTRVGSFLRRYSLDELPQLWNVVRGDLSLVGPRPELAAVVARYEPWQHRRHAVKPGITGLWQVTERDENGQMHLHVETDLRYIRGLGVRTDAAILLMTIPAVLGRRPVRDLGLHAVGRDPRGGADALPSRLRA